MQDRGIVGRRNHNCYSIATPFFYMATILSPIDLEEGRAKLKPVYCTVTGDPA